MPKSLRRNAASSPSSSPFSLGQLVVEGSRQEDRQADLQLDVVGQVRVRVVPRGRVERILWAIRHIGARSDGNRLDLLVLDEIPYLEYGREPAIEKDPEANAHVEVDVVVPTELAIVRIDDRDRLRSYDAHATLDERVVVEDKVAKTGKLSVHGHIREIHIAAQLIVIQRNGYSGCPTILEVEVRRRIQSLIEVSVDTNREHLRDVVVERKTRGVVLDELVVQRDREIGHDLEAACLDHVLLLYGINFCAYGLFGLDTEIDFLGRLTLG